MKYLIGAGSAVAIALAISWVLAWMFAKVDNRRL